jgi:hypothetical protein
MEGLKAVAEKNLDRADFLTRMALRRQKERPGVTSAIWKEFQAFLEGQKLQHSDRLGRLLFYRDSLEAVLENCRTQKDFDAVWTVRREVQKAIRKSRNLLQEELVNEVSAFQKQTDNLGGPALALEAFSNLRIKLEVRLALLISTAEKKESVRPFHEVVTRLVSDVEKEVEKWQKEIGAITAQNSVEPAQKKGPVEKLLQNVHNIAVTLNKANLGPFLKDNKSLLTLNRDLETLHARLVKLQKIRFNLWAVNQIYRAETASTWDVLLGSIDLAQLHPATASLYSLAYEKRIREKENADSRVRSQRIRILLTTPKIPLEVF